MSDQTELEQLKVEADAAWAAAWDAALEAEREAWKAAREARKAVWEAARAAGAKPDYCRIAALDAARARAWKDRNTRCGCDHNESCAECFPPAFHTGGYWDQQRASLQQTTSLSTKESDDAND